MFHLAAFFFILSCLLSPLAQASAEPIRMIRSLSGPSGKVVGTKFVLDEMRSRFVYPQDNTLTVYFEFQAPKGDYVLTAYWKDPQGRVAGISPDLKIQTVSEDLTSYWVFMIDSNRASGIWTVEIRINGEPAGTHSFELVVPHTPEPAVADTPALPTLDEIYRSGIKSLVWVHKLDAAGRRVDTSTGFVVAPGSVLTAFQSIDSAARIEIEFADGNTSATDEILACNRLQDWAIIKAGTRNAPPFQIGKPEPAVVGEQAIVFGIGSGTSRTIGSVDIIGQGKVSVFGERININPQLPPMAVGGPLLDQFGKVIGVIGGSVAPGFSLDHSRISADLAVTSLESFPISATPIGLITLQPQYPAATLQNMLDSGILTPPLSKTPVFNFGAVTDNIAGDYSYVSRSRFSRKSPKVIVYTIWRAKQLSLILHPLCFCPPLRAF